MSLTELRDHTASPPPESRRLRHGAAKRDRADQPASRPPESRRLRRGRATAKTLPPWPPHPPRNRGDCGWAADGQNDCPHGRLTPPGIAATAAQRAVMSDATFKTRLTPPGIAATAASCFHSSIWTLMTASRPPESRRLRPERRLLTRLFRRLTPPGIAATAAQASQSTNVTSLFPPHAPRSRGDCGLDLARRFLSCPSASRFPQSRRLRRIGRVSMKHLSGRLTLPGVAATAATDILLCIFHRHFRLTIPAVAATAATFFDG